jgi:uncharacterized membrane protein YGL010W
MNDRPEGLLAWQWSLYPEGHRDRVNLILHLVTVPVFMAGTLAAISAAFTIWWRAPAGLGAIVIAFALQGVGHGREAARPVPFRGPLDVLARIFVEQWVTFPRYVVSGRWLRALRGEAAPPRA